MNAIFFKEWIKTRWYLLLACIVTLGFAGYSMLRINRVVELKGAAHVWEVMLSRDAVFVNLLEYAPLLVGILLALVQFIPEMYHKCLKLTLHLPYPQLKMINLMLLYGLLTLVICFATNYIPVSYTHLDVYKRQIIPKKDTSSEEQQPALTSGWNLI